jgi:flagella basal body P-ring formation protein FlgA
LLIIAILSGVGVIGGCIIAQASEERVQRTLRDQLEAKIAQEKEVDHVVITLQNPAIANKEGLDIIQIDYGINGHFQAFVSGHYENSTKEYRSTVIGKYAEAILIPALSRTYFKGETIDEEDITVTKVLAHTVNPIICRDKESLVGKYVKRTIVAGRAVNSTSLRSEIVIKTGQQVVIKYVNRNLLIKTEGKALESGGIGDAIKVKTLENEKILYGKVQEAGVVVIGEPK